MYISRIILAPGYSSPPGVLLDTLGEDGVCRGILTSNYRNTSRDGHKNPREYMKESQGVTPAKPGKYEKRIKVILTS